MFEKDCPERVTRVAHDVPSKASLYAHCARVLVDDTPQLGWKLRNALHHCYTITPILTAGRPAAWSLGTYACLVVCNRASRLRS